MTSVNSKSQKPALRISWQHRFTKNPVKTHLCEAAFSFTGLFSQFSAVVGFSEDECKWGSRTFSRSSIWLACKWFNWLKKLGSKLSKIWGLFEIPVFSLVLPLIDAGLVIGCKGNELKETSVALEADRLGRSSSSGVGSGKILLVWKRLVEC